MKILVMSDSHEVITPMFKAIEAETPDLVLHLGDHARDCEDITLAYPELPLRRVRGNCDRGSYELEIDEFVTQQVRFLMTHGHIFGVKTGLGSIMNAATSINADIVLFGHTHKPLCKTIPGDITLINPGSISLGSETYAIIELSNGTFTAEIRYITAK